MPQPRPFKSKSGATDFTDYTDCVPAHSPQEARPWHPWLEPMLDVPGALSPSIPG